MIDRLEDAEHSVRQIFLREFPNLSFPEWNKIINDKAAEDIIKNVGRASSINVKKFMSIFAN